MLRDTLRIMSKPDARPPLIHEVVTANKPKPASR
jgi:hypothetical protein